MLFSPELDIFVLTFKCNVVLSFRNLALFYIWIKTHWYCEKVLHHPSFLYILPPRSQALLSSALDEQQFSGLLYEVFQHFCFSIGCFFIHFLSGLCTFACLFVFKSPVNLLSLTGYCIHNFPIIISLDESVKNIN